MGEKKTQRNHLISVSYHTLVVISPSHPIHNPRQRVMSRYRVAMRGKRRTSSSSASAILLGMMGLHDRPFNPGLQWQI